MEGHNLAKFTNNSIKPSLIAGTKKWNTLHDQQERESVESEFLSDDDEVNQPEPRNFRPLGALERDNGVQSLTVNRDTSTAEFYKRIEELKREHQTTLSLLNDLYEQRGDNYKCHTDTDGTKQSHYRDQDIKVPDYLKSTNHSGLLYDHTPKPHPIPGFPKCRVKFADSEKYDMEKNYDSSEMSNSDSAEIISRMWDDFSVDDYSDKGNRRPRPKTAPVKSWRPVITIPQPFNMTLREEMKKSKSHTRSSVEVSQREQHRRETETHELMKRSRPRDPPAHIYLPLYEEIKERREQRSRFNRDNSVATLMAVQQPFKFAERDAQKLKAKKEKLKEKDEQELKQIKKMAKFRAQPVPPSVHDPAVADRMIEDKLYRNIKVKMRSEDLMRSSALPPRMHSHELMSLERRKHWQEEVERNTKLTFQPVTRSMPDFEVLHKREQLATLRKGEKETTVMQPFNLHTSNRSSVRMREREEQVERMKESYLEEERVRRRMYKSPIQSDTVPTRMTDSARLRIENMKQSLQEAEMALKEVREGQMERKERRRQLALRVQEKSGVNDTSVTRELEREEKLRRHKKELREREANYNKFLREVKQRVDGRPLLFEQYNEKMAKAQAEKRYNDILESSGLSDNFLRASIGSNQSHDLKSANRSYDDDSFEDSALSPRMHSTKRSKASSSSSGSDVSDELNDVTVDRRNEEVTKVKEVEVTS